MHPCRSILPRTMKTLLVAALAALVHTTASAELDVGAAADRAMTRLYGPHAPRTDPNYAQWHYKHGGVDYLLRLQAINRKKTQQGERAYYALSGDVAYEQKGIQATQGLVGFLIIGEH